MAILIYPANQSPVARWSKGTTQQLFIYPEQASFSAGDYHLRLSVATVEADSSRFTPLAGVQRRLMVLSGRQQLTHRGHHSANLGPFEQDCFSADWETDCLGQATNFNLMTKGDCESALEVQELADNQSLQFEMRAERGFVYVVSGSLNYLDVRLNAGDGLALEHGDIAELTSLEAATLIVAHYSAV